MASKLCETFNACRLHEVQQGQMQVPAHGSLQSQEQMQAAWKMDWEQPCGKGFGGVGG